MLNMQVGLDAHVQQQCPGANAWQVAAAADRAICAVSEERQEEWNLSDMFMYFLFCCYLVACFLATSW